MQWTDILEISEALYDANPQLDPMTVRFTELAKMVQALPSFTGEPGRYNERILEAIQMAWVDERD